MEAIWEQVKVVVRQNMPAHSYRMWIEPVQCQRNAEDGITLLCPNQFYKKRILDHYMDALAAALESTAGRPLKLRLAVADRPQRIAPVDCAPQQLPLPDIHQASYTGRILRRNFTFDQFVVSDNNGFAYSAALALLAAIENAGSTDYDAIVNALRNKEVDTPVGSIKFDERGDAIGVGFAMYQVQNGQFVELK